MFVEENHGTNKGDLFEDLRKRVVVAHQAGKSYKNNFYKVWTPLIHSRTDYVQMEEMQDHCYPPQEWSTNKITSKAKRAMVQEIARDFRVTSKQCWALTS